MFSSNGGRDFLAILSEMEALGYDIEWQMLNSKYFGVPQSRERVYVVGYLGDISGREIFPIPEGNLEDRDVQEQCTGTITTRTGQADAVGTYTIEGSQFPQEIRQIGKMEAKRDNPQPYRVYDSKGIAPTLNCMEGGGRQPHIVEDLKIRKLTPRECWRLQGIPDECFDKASKVNSDAQLYKQAGNACTVNVIEHIGKQIMKGEEYEN